MKSNEFNEMPKDALMVISNIDKFTEFVVFNSLQKAVGKLLLTLFQKRTYATKLIEKYVVRHNLFLKEFVKDAASKYITKSVSIDEEEIDDDFIKEIGVVGEIKRGDIDKVVVQTTNTMLFAILNDMCNDKLVKLCWDSKGEDFVWMLRLPNEPDMIETSYKTPKKRINKKQK